MDRSPATECPGGGFRFESKIHTAAATLAGRCKGCSSSGAAYTAARARSSRRSRDLGELLHWDRVLLRPIDSRLRRLATNPPDPMRGHGPSLLNASPAACGADLNGVRTRSVSSPAWCPTRTEVRTSYGPSRTEVRTALRSSPVRCARATEVRTAREQRDHTTPAFGPCLRSVDGSNAGEPWNGVAAGASLGSSALVSREGGVPTVWAEPGGGANCSRLESGFVSRPDGREDV